MSCRSARNSPSLAAAKNVARGLLRRRAVGIRLRARSHIAGEYHPSRRWADLCVEPAILQRGKTAKSAASVWYNKATNAGEDRAFAADLSRNSYLIYSSYRSARAFADRNSSALQANSSLCAP